MKLSTATIIHTRMFHIVSFILDVISVSYFVYSSFFLATPWIGFEITIGIYFLAEYVVLFLGSRSKWAYMRHPLAISNILVIIGYLAAPFWNVGFLSILRALRIIQIYQLIPDIRMLTHRFIFWEKLATTIAHFLVLIFIITEIVFFMQKDINHEITTKFDAFYFTTNALAKIGNGETIELVGVQGQILTLIIAVLSLSIFVQLMDTAREYRRKKSLEQEAELNPTEAYSEQICTFCDIKQRDSYAPKD